MTEIPRSVPDPALEPTISIPRAAAILGVSRRHIYSLVERGEIPSIPVGQRKVLSTARFLVQFQLAPTPTGSDS